MCNIFDFFLVLKLTHVFVSGYEERVKMPPKKRASLSRATDKNRNKAAAKAKAKAAAAAKAKAISL